MKTIDRIDSFLGRVLLALSGAAVLALMLLATGNVVLRIFHAPYRGTYEIVSFLGAIGVAFALAIDAAAQGEYRRGHPLVPLFRARAARDRRPLVSDQRGLLRCRRLADDPVWGTRIMGSGEVSETLKIVYHPFDLRRRGGFRHPRPHLLFWTCPGPSPGKGGGA